MDLDRKAAECRADMAAWHKTKTLEEFAPELHAKLKALCEAINHDPNDLGEAASNAYHDALRTLLKIDLADAE